MKTIFAILIMIQMSVALLLRDKNQIAYLVYLCSHHFGRGISSGSRRHFDPVLSFRETKSGDTNDEYPLLVERSCTLYTLVHLFARYTNDQSIPTKQSGKTLHIQNSATPITYDAIRRMIIWMPFGALGEEAIFLPFLALLIYALVQDTDFNVILTSVFHLFINLSNLLFLNIIHETSFMVLNTMVWSW